MKIMIMMMVCEGGRGWMWTLSFVYLYFYRLIDLFIRSFIHSFIHSFYSFIEQNSILCPLACLMYSSSISVAFYSLIFVFVFVSRQHRRTRCLRLQQAYAHSNESVPG